MTHKGRPVLTGTTIFNLDDTGVYFEPAKLHHDGDKAYVDQPFYIVNPITSLRRKPLNKPVPHTSKGYSILDNLNTYRSYTFFYRKADAALVKARLNAKNHSSAKDLYKIKQTLSKCLDLHNLATSRKYNNDSELIKTWGPEKFHKISKLSDDELKTTIQQECNETEKFVGTNVKEINKKRPKKQVLSDNENSTRTKRNELFLKPNFSNSYVRAKSRNVHMKDKNDKDHDFPILPNTTTYATTLPSDSTVHSAGVRDYTPIETKIPPPTTPVVELFHITHANDIDESKLLQDKSDKVLEFVKPNDGTNKNPFMVNYKDWTVENMPMPHLSYGIIWYDKMKAANKLPWSRKLKTASANRKNRKNITLIYAEYRPDYDESETPSQNVETREFANDTIMSVINGAEDLHHDDSLIVTDDSDFLITSHVNEPNNPTDIEKEVGDDIFFLLRNLYILFGEDYIPAKLIKNPDGKLIYVLDDTRLCTPHKKHEKMLILSGLCNDIN